MGPLGPSTHLRSSTQRTLDPSYAPSNVCDPGTPRPAEKGCSFWETQAPNPKFVGPYASPPISERQRNWSCPSWASLYWIERNKKMHLIWNTFLKFLSFFLRTEGLWEGWSLESWWYESPPNCLFIYLDPETDLHSALNSTAERSIPSLFALSRQCWMQGLVILLKIPF